MPFLHQFSKVKSGQKTGFFRKIEFMKNFLEFLEDFGLSFEIPRVFFGLSFFAKCETTSLL